MLMSLKSHSEMKWSFQMQTVKSLCKMPRNCDVAMKANHGFVKYRS